MKDTEKIKNYCRTDVESNSMLPRACHIIDSLWFKGIQNILIFTVIWPQQQKETLIANPPIGTIRLNMSLLLQAVI